jgi:outer membrane biosynthesis protein TonB
MRDSRGFIYSTTLHGILLFFLIVGLPSFFQRPIEEELEAISVDILPIAPISNVKPQDAPQEEEKKKPVEEKNVEKKAAPETKKEEVKKPEEAPVKIPDKKKPEIKKPEKKKEEKKKVEDPLKAILNDVKAHARAEEGKKPTAQKTTPNAKPAKSQTYDPGLPLSMSDKDAIRGQIEHCWDPPVGAKDAQNLIVTLHIELNPDGSVIRVELAGNQSRYNSDSFFRAAADSAIRAVNRCSPLKNLPADKYNVRDGWKEMILDFDPKDAL